jgi:SAM-dependent methyltransferase
MALVGPILRRVLSHPLTRGIDLDDPRTTALRREIIQGKPFLRKIYHEWYCLLKDDLPLGDGRVLELGSGAGFLRQLVPEVIASEVFICPGAQVVLDGLRMPLADRCLRGILMTNVLHHLADVRRFFREAARTVRGGGVIAMVEPWYSLWANLIYTRLHHEPYLPRAPRWEFEATGPLSGANEALAWVVFQRDRAIFEQEFPQWRIEKLQPLMPLRYLLSGGVSMRSIVPGCAFTPMRLFERAMGNRGAMFAHIVLRRVP